ncbi:hypothetical protein EBR25_10170 [bacterium]|nr:hypothetical protein [bacterium]
MTVGNLNPNKITKTDDSLELSTLREIIEKSAHRIGNSLQVIQSGINRIKRRIPDHDKELDSLSLMQNSTDDLLLVFRTLQEFSKHSLSSEEDIDLLSLVEESIEDASVRYAKCDFSIEVESEATEYRSKIDAEPFVGILHELIKNAQQSAPGERKVFFSFGVRSYDSQPFVEMLIGDDGPGFRRDSKESAFSVFYTTRDQTFGLGLPRARRVVEAHGGKIELMLDVRYRVRILLPLS